ncbi:MAG: 2-hydroxychromene-2-carboxylate isomerase [Pseudomonadota bacterium]
MRPIIELLFDFVSPNAYLVWHPLKALAQRTGADIKVTPAYLGGIMEMTGNQPPMMRDSAIKGKNDYTILEIRRFCARHGLSKFQINPHFPFRSLTLQRYLLAAEEEASRQQMMDVLLPMLWEDKLDPKDTKTIDAALTAAGFEMDSLKAKAGTAAIKEALKANTAEAVERGAFGIPTFFIGDEMFFGKERLGQIEEMLTGA